MTEQRETTSDTVVRNVRALRQSRGWSAARLAEQCAADYPALTVSVLSNIESGRRDETGRRRREVSVDELVALAHALEVSPATLLNTAVRVSGTATGEALAVELTDSGAGADRMVVVPSEIRMDYGDTTVVYAYKTNEEGDDDGH